MRPARCAHGRRPSHSRAAAALAAALLALATGVLGQVNPTAAPGDGEAITLNLVAAYGPGLTPPASGPTLIAKAITGKRISCELAAAEGLPVTAVATAAEPDAGADATTLSPPASPVVTAAAASAALASAPAASACAGPLLGGTYNLLASFVEGANFPTWACYAAAPGAASASAASTAAAAPMFSAQAVRLPGGAAYTCVATYTKASPRAVATAAAIDWDRAMATAATRAAAISAGACPALRFAVPRRASWSKAPAPLKIVGNQLYANNAPFRIKGINWFGFNVAMGMVDGLWAGGTDLATDFGKITYQLRLLGYNAVRLPFTFTNLANPKVWELVRKCTAASDAQLKQRLVDPTAWAANAGKHLPGNPAPLGNTKAGTCNDYLPGTLNEDRLLFVMQQFNNLGMYVVLDYQPQGTEEHAYSLTKFVNSWTALWKKVTCLPNFEADLAGRVLVDVMNEPDSMGIKWEATGDRPGAQQLFLGTADALWAATPNKVRFMFEGTGQNNFGLNWGNGFVIDTDLINSRGLSDPRRFFNYLIKKPYTRWGGVIFTPHVYPPSITGSTYLGDALYEQCDKAFGWLQAPGYQGQTYPVFVGETGSAMATASDLQWLNDFADYMNGKAGRQALDGWMWWAYNENSGDTGGIVTNGWQDLNWTKLRYMISKLGLQPWYTWTGVGRRRRRIEDEAGATFLPADSEQPAVERAAGTPTVAPRVRAVVPAADAVGN